MSETPIAPLQYILTEGERATMQLLNIAANNAKAKLYDLTIAMDQARAEIVTAEHRFGGALALIASSRGMGGAQLAPDFSCIISQGSGE